MAETTKSNTQILQELEALSQSLYQSHTSTTSRRTASLTLPRNEAPPVELEKDKTTLVNPKPRSRRMSLSPWRSRLKLDPEENEKNQQTKPKNKWADEAAAAYSEKKGIWNWKPIRALTHISMQKLICLFSVEVVAVQGLPPSMNGLRLSVCVRKKETKDGAVQTMPSRVAEGVADFDETLFIRCRVYFTPGSGTQMKFEPRPFLIYVAAVDAEELNFGRNLVDLSGLIQESIEKSFKGKRITQWDISFNLSGKAKGGELVLKLGFQIMDKDGVIGIYSQVEGQKSVKNRNYSPFARRQSKTSFSVPSPRLSSRGGTRGAVSDRFQGIDALNLDEPAYQPLTNHPSQQKGTTMNDDDLPEFEVVEKGVEISGKHTDEEDENSDKRSVSSEVVKEVVQDRSHLRRLSELDSISQQIKALESMMAEEKGGMTDEETKSQILDAEEDKLTRVFLQMLEDSEDKKLKISNDQNRSRKLENDEDIKEFFVPDLGKGLGCVIQTRNGGYLVAINPTETKVARKEIPKLAMQMSKPLVIQLNTTGFELLQKIASTGLQELTSDVLSFMPMDELTGKTAEQIAFEGIASAIIQGRNREGATSTAAKTVTAVKSMVTAMNIGRKDRLLSGIWTVIDDPLTVEEILAFSLQKIENLVTDCLKIQADIADEDASFDVSPLDQITRDNRIIANAVPVEDWIKVSSTKSETITISVIVQLRDPVRQYEAVGGPLIVLIHANEYDSCRDDEKRYKVASLQVGGIKVRNNLEAKSVWDGEKQKLTALQWLVVNGMGKGGKKGKKVPSKELDFVWSFSCRIVADMWLKAIRNPDVKFTK